MCISILVNSFDYLVPLVRSALFVLRVRFSDKIDAQIGRREEGPKVILECLFVWFGKRLCETNEEMLSFCLVFFDLVGNFFVSLQFLLNFAFKSAVNENTSPSHLVNVNVGTFPVHQIFWPFTIVGSAVCVYHFPAAVHLAFTPRSKIDRSRGKLITAVTMHFVFWPVTVIYLLSATSMARWCELPVTML